jgi:hypothetical protein
MDIRNTYNFSVRRTEGTRLLGKCCRLENYIKRYLKKKHVAQNRYNKPVGFIKGKEFNDQQRKYQPLTEDTAVQDYLHSMTNKTKWYFGISEDLASLSRNSPVSALMLAARWKWRPGVTPVPWYP